MKGCVLWWNHRRLLCRRRLPGEAAGGGVQRWEYVTEARWSLMVACGEAGWRGDRLEEDMYEGDEKPTNRTQMVEVGIVDLNHIYGFVVEGGLAILGLWPRC